MTMHSCDGLFSSMLDQKIFGILKGEDCGFQTCYGCPFIDICYQDEREDVEGFCADARIIWSNGTQINTVRKD